MTKKVEQFEYRVVQSIGNSDTETRRLKGVGNQRYSLSTVIPSVMCRTLSLTAGDILRFSIDSSKKLIHIEKVPVE